MRAKVLVEVVVVQLLLFTTRSSNKSRVLTQPYDCVTEWCDRV